MDVKAIQELFDDQVLPAIQFMDAWEFKCFVFAVESSCVIDFKARLREDLNARQQRKHGGAKVWADLPVPIGDYADLDGICELIINQLLKNHPVRNDWENSIHG